MLQHVPLKAWYHQNYMVSYLRSHHHENLKFYKEKCCLLGISTALCSIISVTPARCWVNITQSWAFQRLWWSGMWRSVVCKIWGFHGDYEECRLLGCGAVWAELPPHAGSSLANFSTLKMEAIRSSKSSVHTRPPGRHIPEHDVLLSVVC
jgi:hypothetical protein